MDSMDSLNEKMDSGSKTEGDAKTSADTISTAAIKAKSSDRADRSVKRRQAKRREAMRKYSKDRYANQSAEQKKEAAEKSKQRKQDKAKKENDNLNNKMTTEEVKHLTKIPDMVYKARQSKEIGKNPYQLPQDALLPRNAIVPPRLKQIVLRIVEMQTEPYGTNQIMSAPPVPLSVPLPTALLEKKIARIECY